MTEYEFVDKKEKKEKRCKRCDIKLVKDTVTGPSVHDSDYCYNCSCWNIIFKNFRELHSDNLHWLEALDDMDILLRKYKRYDSPDPTRFARMLYDRGLEFSDIEKRVWNLSCDQCLPYHVTKYISDDKATQFLGKIFSSIRF